MIALGQSGRFCLDRRSLVDAWWAWSEPLLPDRKPKQGGPWRDHREVIDVVASKFHIGTQWAHLPGMRWYSAGEPDDQSIGRPCGGLKTKIHLAAGTRCPWPSISPPTMAVTHPPSPRHGAFTYSPSQWTAPHSALGGPGRQGVLFPRKPRGTCEGAVPGRYPRPGVSARPSPVARQPGATGHPISTKGLPAVQRRAPGSPFVCPAQPGGIGCLFQGLIAHLGPREDEDPACQTPVTVPSHQGSASAPKCPRNMAKLERLNPNPQLLKIRIHRGRLVKSIAMSCDVIDTWLTHPLRHGGMPR